MSVFRDLRFVYSTRGGEMVAWARLIRSEEMRNTVLFVFGLLVLFGSATHSAAQVKRVQMHIAGYLCGN